MKNKLQKAGILVILLSIVGGSLFSFWRTQVFSKNQAVPILCYHKISTDPDPMSISPERFKEQLVALKEMGYHSKDFQRQFLLLKIVIFGLIYLVGTKFRSFGARAGGLDPIAGVM